jgi:uncharacterized protein YndB with AHSA1/START domain
MPLDKDFKRLVRGRMQKTGESYTAARSTLLKKPVPGKAAIKPASSDYPKLAGMSDAAICAKTGCTWAGWVKLLDKVGAQAWPHRQIAECVHTRFKIGDWWSQSVAVGYERIKGLREIGQRRSGAYEANRSKTIAAPVEKIYRAFTDARVRDRWLPGLMVTIRKAVPNKSVRITWDDDTSVEVWLIAKGDTKASVAVTHRKVAGKEDAASRKVYWGERLEALAELLER